MAEKKGQKKSKKKPKDIIIENAECIMHNAGGDTSSAAKAAPVSPAGSVTLEEKQHSVVSDDSSAATLPKGEGNGRSDGEGKRQRDERGRFVKGHEPLEGAGFQPGNLESSKYDAKYPEDMKRHFRQVALEGNYPTFESYADEIGVTVRTLENWCEAYPLFKDAYEACKNLQKGSLIEGAMMGRFNPTFAKFVAVNCHGMKEKVESEVKGSGGFNISVEYFEGEEDK